jgi:autotransporter-associated beta strand protein
MKNHSDNPSSALLEASRTTVIAGVLSVFLLALALQSTYAGSATWNAAPGSATWNTAANWTPATVPNGPADTATFDVSTGTNLSLSAATELSEIVFDSGASAYSIGSDGPTGLTISGAGITNNSSNVQKFVAGGPLTTYGGGISFINSATAGSSTLFTITGPTSSTNAGSMSFTGSSTAGNASFVLGGGDGTTSSVGGIISFFDNSNLGNGSFTLNGAVASGGSGGALIYAPANMTDPVTGNYLIHGGAVSGAQGGQIYIAGSLAAAISSDITIEGGAAPGATGGHMGFQPLSVPEVDANFVVGGGNAAGATGGSFYYQLSSVTEVPTDFNGTFTVNGGTVSGAGGGTADLYLINGAIAGATNFIVNGGVVAGALGGSLEFDYNDIGVRTFTANGGHGSGATGGFLYLYGAVTNGTLIANGGTSRGAGGMVVIYGGSPMVPRMEAFGNGSLDLSGWTSPADAAASIEGSGQIFLGANRLTAGSNNLDTTFSGVIQDGGVSGGTLGALTKVGAGTLTLSGANSYTGGTNVNAGTLFVSNTRGSATGSGPVTVTTSTLGGIGIINGAVTIGNTSGVSAFLSPGDAAAGTLTIKRQLRVLRNATYICEWNSDTSTAGAVAAKGVVTNRALISLTDIGTSTLPLGTVFTIVNNTSAGPIGGNFSNLADGATITVGSNNLQANYEGGDGNDLTLTVVP